jgi:coenzyme PQQ precursor peptide PqqA
MKWTAPKVVEVPVGMEINMYACATRRSVLKMRRTG